MIARSTRRIGDRTRCRMNPFRCLVAVMACATVALTGCGGGHGASVSGSVTLDGAPLDTGTVAFHPLGGGPTAYGGIHPNGTYRLKTGAGTGVPPGEYRVTVAAMTEPPTDGPSVPGRMITPPRYADPAQSGLKFAVTPGSNRIDLELTTGGAAK